MSKQVLNVACPSCRTAIVVKTSALEKTVQCPKCRALFKVSARPHPVAAAAAPRQAEATTTASTPQPVAALPVAELPMAGLLPGEIGGVGRGVAGLGRKRLGLSLGAGAGLMLAAVVLVVTSSRRCRRPRSRHRIRAAADRSAVSLRPTQA
jgi:predicted Zn finger-like uncharacterized protein